ncbi:Smr/MutS family protein [Chelativorans sp. Marseille-P2723]|uniref:Smr/MutS family protein n=1 Tax=Chelativorans sp. Marseille-P2723 TaxID=2709133 RepID=UPI00156D520E|nr:Smr/MutS family protein [Chelativorans sp. Marseille-P2723]
MKTRASGKLTTEDRILWSRVARTAKAMPGKSYPDAPTSEEHQSFERMIDDQPPLRKSEAPSAGAAIQSPHRLDQPTHQKIARGRIQIAGRVDLHGLTQEEAYALLLSFLQQAHASDRRHVLVITGKGSGQPEGVLRRVVPLWLATAPFSQIVSGFDAAARHHGGSGALYVRLRRLRS